MIKGLDQLEIERETYDKDSRAFIDSLKFVDRELTELNSMKSTEGWKILDKKLRDELHAKINDLVKDDPVVKTLLALMNVADTKTQEERLNNEIASLIPE